MEAQVISNNYVKNRKSTIFIIPILIIILIGIAFIYIHDRGIYNSLKNDPTTISAFANNGTYAVTSDTVCYQKKYYLFGFDIKETNTKLTIYTK